MDIHVIVRHPRGYSHADMSVSLCMWTHPWQAALLLSFWNCFSLLVSITACYFDNVLKIKMSGKWKYVKKHNIKMFSHLRHVLMRPHTTVPASHTFNPQVEWAIPAFIFYPHNIITLWAVLTSYPAEGRRLSWPEWLITYEDGIPWIVTHLILSTNGDQQRITLMCIMPLFSCQSTTLNKIFNHN